MFQLVRVRAGARAVAASSGHAAEHSGPPSARLASRTRLRSPAVTLLGVARFAQGLYWTRPRMHDQQDSTVTETADDLCPTARAAAAAVDRAARAADLSVDACTSVAIPSRPTPCCSGRESGYVYGRDGHPNADMLAEKCRAACTAPSGPRSPARAWRALALVVLSQLEPGDHVVVSNQLYGRTLTLLTIEAARLGIASTVVDTCDLPAVEAALTPRIAADGRRNDQQSAVARGRSRRLGRIGSSARSGAVGRQYAGRTGRLPAARVGRRLGDGKRDQDDERAQRRDPGTAVRTGRPLAARAGSAVDLGTGQRSVRLLAGAARSGHAGRAHGAGLCQRAGRWRKCLAECEAGRGRLLSRACRIIRTTNWRGASLAIDLVRSSPSRCGAAPRLPKRSCRPRNGFRFARRWAN